MKSDPLIIPKGEPVKAIYQPRADVPKSSRLDDCAGREFQFREARPVNGERKFWPDDINFYGSSPVSEHDLRFKDDAIQASK